MSFVSCAFNAAAGWNIIRAHVLETSRLDSSRHRCRLGLQNVSYTVLKVSEAITSHVPIAESRAGANYGDLNKVAVPVHLQAPSIDTIIKSIYPDEGQIISHRSSPAPKLMVYEAPDET